MPAINEIYNVEYTPFPDKNRGPIDEGRGDARGEVPIFGVRLVRVYAVSLKGK